MVDSQRAYPLPQGMEGARDGMFNLLDRPCHVAVEIGSFLGWWARRFLLATPEATLYCVDPWGEGCRVTPPGSNEELVGDGVYREWRLNTEEFRERCVALRGTSEEWSSKFNGEIDFLFVDGVHKVPAVLADLRGWVPKVRRGGLIVGHDWRIPRVRRGVKKYWMDEGLRRQDGAKLPNAARSLYWGVFTSFGDSAKSMCYWWKKT